ITSAANPPRCWSRKPTGWSHTCSRPRRSARAVYACVAAWGLANSGDEKPQAANAEEVTAMVDALIIGAGPNGLVAGATLARHGWQVLVLEAKDRPGGAVWSEEYTLPGYRHDVGAAFFPFADDSPAFRHLDLVGAGLQWRNAPFESCHAPPRA